MLTLHRILYRRSHEFSSSLKCRGSCITGNLNLKTCASDGCDRLGWQAKTVTCQWTDYYCSFSDSDSDSFESRAKARECHTSSRVASLLHRPQQRGRLSAASQSRCSKTSQYFRKFLTKWLRPLIVCYHLLASDVALFVPPEKR